MQTTATPQMSTIQSSWRLHDCITPTRRERSRFTTEIAIASFPIEAPTAHTSAEWYTNDATTHTTTSWSNGAGG